MFWTTVSSSRHSMAELGSSWTRSVCWKSIHFPPSLPSPTWRSVLKEKTLTSLTVTASVQIDFTARCLCFQFRYKRRVYTQSYVDDKQLAKLHTKVEMCNQNKVQTQFSNSKFVTTSPHSLHWESCCHVFQANLKRFMEHVHQKNVEKVSKWLEKGLDPNFHDSDTGGADQRTFLTL